MRQTLQDLEDSHTRFGQIAAFGLALCALDVYSGQQLSPITSFAIFAVGAGTTFFGLLGRHDIKQQHDRAKRNVADFFHHQHQQPAAPQPAAQTTGLGTAER